MSLLGPRWERQDMYFSLPAVWVGCPIPQRSAVTLPFGQGYL